MFVMRAPLCDLTLNIYLLEFEFSLQFTDKHIDIVAVLNLFSYSSIFEYS